MCTHPGVSCYFSDRDTRLIFNVSKDSCDMLYSHSYVEHLVVLIPIGSCLRRWLNILRRPSARETESKYVIFGSFLNCFTPVVVPQCVTSTHQEWGERKVGLWG